MLMMSTYRFMLSRIGQCSAAALAGGSGILLNSILIQPHQQQQQSLIASATTIPKSWRTVEYAPTAVADPIIPYNQKLASQQQSNLQEKPVHLSRKVLSEVDKTGLGLRLYQYQTCPYCCKVRAFLDFFGFSYEVVEVNPVTRSQIKFSKDYKKVPILRTASYELPLKESSLIVSTLATFLVRPDLSLSDILTMYPEQTATNEKTGKPTIEHLNQYFVMWGETKLSGDQIQDAREEREWREWVDSHFIHLISPNVYRTWSESLETFRWFEQVGDWQQNFPTWERILAIYVGAAAMFAISKRLKKRHHIINEREEMQKAFEKFLAARGPHRKYMGGDQPNLADLALYGACNSFYGCTAFAEMRQSNPEIGHWFDAVDEAVKEGRGKDLLKAKSQQIEQQQKRQKTANIGA